MPLTPRRRYSAAVAKVDPSSSQPIDAVEQPKPVTNQCTAHKRNGERCRKSSIVGSNVCATHGGSAPQVKRKAQVRILMSMDLAAAKVVALMQDKKVPYATQLAAARELLDRGGLAARQQVDIDAQVSGTVIWEQRIQESIINWGELSSGDFNPADAYDDDVEDAVIVQDSDIRRQQRNAEIVEAGKQRDEPPGPRAEQPGGPMQAGVPLSHGETYSERSERQHQEARAREMGQTPRNPGGARSTRAQMGRPKRP